MTRATRHNQSRPVGRPCISRTRVCVQGSYQDELVHGEHAVAVGVYDFEHLVKGVGVHEGGRRSLLRRHTLLSCDVSGSLTCRVGELEGRDSVRVSQAVGRTAVEVLASFYLVRVRDYYAGWVKL